MTDHNTDAATRDTQLTIRRTFDAPRERVYRAFVDPDELEQWFVPEGMEAEVHALESEPGGEMFVSWTSDENGIENEGTFEEVIENERLVTVEEIDGGQLHLTYEFHDAEDGTEVVLTQEFPGSVPDGAEEGWASILDNLDALVTDTETDEGRSMTVSRVIEASPERVYEAFLDPDELAQWLPPTGFFAEVHHLEPEVGGTYRMAFTGETEELAEYGSTFGGTYLELVPGERIVYTDEFETDDPEMAGETTVTVTFEAVPEGTEITVHHEGFPEAIPPSDANEGWTDSLSNLAELVEETS
ncbi:SRPBCC family protein [Natronosalvus rutilus]|uniref:SRPBCC family protein n=1 Tax=Natronosalvus rutilus TaxID=2953753 RepID=A0A9E7SUL4_9EURY|nr:SRPBCC family protein [Natronosalvus rutilus]UTF52106.1 SRPBCC family protein [Natronosalvus rutilus]